MQSVEGTRNLGEVEKVGEAPPRKHTGPRRRRRRNKSSAYASEEKGEGLEGSVGSNEAGSKFTTKSRSTSVSSISVLQFDTFLPEHESDER